MTPSTLVGVLAAVGWTAVAYATRRREALQGTDEGYLWYGMQRVLAGGQPVRDFRAYEPGRYWLAALLARVRGDGLVTTRVANHLAAGLALVVLAVALGRLDAPVPAQMAIPAAVLGWGVRSHKLVDVAALVLVAAGGALALGGAPLGPLWLGIAIGMAAVVGLNLGLYGLAAGAIVLATGVVRDTTAAADVLQVVAGGLLGAAPLLVWLVAVPGAARATWLARVVTPRERGTTNLPLPIPWPWDAETAVRGATGRIPRLVVRWGFVLLPVLGVVAAATALAVSDDAVGRVVPLTAVGLVAMHTAVSRADLPHLGAPAPLLLASGCVLPGAAGWAAVVLTVLGTTAIVVDRHPRLQRRRRPRAFVRRTFGSDLVWLPRRTAIELDTLAGQLDPTTAVAAVPFGIPLVAALHRRSAVTDTFAVYPAQGAEDERMRQELDDARPVLVLVDDRAHDGDPELRFSRTHPATWQWLRANASIVPAAASDAGAAPATVTLFRVGDR